MSIDEARELLSQYADGLLAPEPARELEGMLAETPVLQAELKQLKEENALLEEALAPLRSSQSARMRLSDAMLEVHRQATSVAESMPERGWRIFRLVYCLLALIGATLLIQYRPPVDKNGDFNHNGIFFLVVVIVFLIGLVCLVCGGLLANLEAGFTSMLSPVRRKPTALEVLMVQVFGAGAILAAFGMYWWIGGG